MTSEIRGGREFGKGFYEVTPHIFEYFAQSNSTSRLTALAVARPAKIWYHEAPDMFLSL